MSTPARPNYLRCQFCFSHFPINSADPCKACETSSADTHTHRCTYCLTINTHWILVSAEEFQRLVDQRMLSSPKYKCGDCGHQFTQLQCHIHANTRDTCSEMCMHDQYVEKEDQIHHCPLCHTHNSTWFGCPP